MITPAQLACLKERAYVPEHLPGYVTAISGMEPFLFGDYLVYAGEGRMTLVGYPLSEEFDEDRMMEALEQATARFEPGVVSLTAPLIPASMTGCVETSSDVYYRLDLTTLSLSQKLRNMLSRAGRAVSVSRGQVFGREHQRLVREFLETHRLDEATRFIFDRIHEYVKSKTAWLFEARNARGELVAFDVAEFGASHYAFYMFNFRSEKRYVPGASDLLLSHVIEQARAEGKRYINLGLGINPGVTFFKTKWGGMPFLPHTACIQERKRASVWENILDSLLQ
ncbi:MAG: hypothetical protein Kow0063_20190 [Anaerolineae bacterium]